MKAFFDLFVVPNLISKSLVRYLCLKSTPTTRRIIAADGTISKYMGTADKVSVFFGDPKVNVDFLIMTDLPLDKIIGCPTMEKLGTCIDLGN